MTAVNEPIDGLTHVSYIVIGFWYEDEPLVAGVILDAEEAIMQSFYSSELDSSPFQGPWATTVSATDGDHAGRLAIDEMMGTLDVDDD